MDAEHSSDMDSKDYCGASTLVIATTITTTITTLSQTNKHSRDHS